MKWTPILLLAMLLAACGSTQRVNDPPPENDNHPEQPAEADTPPLLRLDGASVPWSEVFVSGKRNIVVFMTPW
ncbi:MAG: hypothetical protein KDB82_14450 [Planctomycetes bacterium]|mgnify:CR=1 FL=1|nr:hypothetical protein [Planctomycetota bacterium]